MGEVDEPVVVQIPDLEICDYPVCVNRTKPPPTLFCIYLCRLRDRLPRIRIPPADDDSDVRVDIQAAVAKL